MWKKLTKATPVELQAWMWGAGIVGFGLGAFVANYFQQYAVWIIAAGAIVHGWAMYKIYSKK